MVRAACEGLDVGPIVADRGAVENFEVAIACDGAERVRSIIERTASDADAGAIPRNYWTRLFCGGGYAARRQAIAEVDAAEARRAALRQEPVPRGEQLECDFARGAEIIAELGWGPGGLRKAALEVIDGGGGEVGDVG